MKEKSKELFREARSKFRENLKSKYDEMDYYNIQKDESDLIELYTETLENYKDLRENICKLILLLHGENKRKIINHVTFREGDIYYKNKTEKCELRNIDVDSVSSSINVDKELKVNFRMFFETLEDLDVNEDRYLTPYRKFNSIILESVINAELVPLKYRKHYMERDRIDYCIFYSLNLDKEESYIRLHGALSKLSKEEAKSASRKKMPRGYHKIDLVENPVSSLSSKDSLILLAHLPYLSNLIQTEKSLFEDDLRDIKELNNITSKLLDVL